MVRERRGPLTGQTWGAGEMDYAVRHHQALAKGWVQEAMTMACVNRAGDFGMTQRPFRYVGKHLVWVDGESSWSTADEDKRTAVNKGIMPEAMIEFMTGRSTGQIFPVKDRDERDASAAEFLTSKGNVVLMYALASDHRRQRTIGTDGDTWIAI